MKNKEKQNQSHDHSHGEKNDHCHDHDHHHDHDSLHGHAHHHRPASKGRLAAVIFFNVIITIAEFIGGLFSGSLALVSDAWHNLSDVLALMLGYAGERVSEKEGASHYTFGLKRFEVLIALINAVTLVFIGIFIVYEAVQRFINPVAIDVFIMVPVALIGLAGNAFSILVLARNRDDNLNMKAAFLHLLYDTISSAAVIVTGLVLYYTGWAWLDLLVSIIIVIMMVASSLSIIVQSLRIFLQGAPRHLDLDRVLGNIENVPGVGTVHGLHVWSVNSVEIFLSCHVCLDPDYPHGGNTDAIIDAINAMLKKKYGISHTTLQLETEMLCSTDEGSCCNRG